MLRQSGLLLALVFAFAATSGTATAASITFSPSGNLTLHSDGSLSFQTEAIEVICPLTMTGTLPRGALARVEGTLVGAITSVSVGACAGGAEVRALNLPWHITYNSILGVAPNELTGMGLTIGGASFLLNVPFGGFGTARCLYRGNLRHLATLVGDNPFLINGIASSGNAISLNTSLGGSLPCPATVRLAGSLDPTRGQTVQEDAGNDLPLSAGVRIVEFVREGSITFTFRNNERAEYYIGTTRLLLTGRGITIARDDCTDETLAEQDTCQVEVRFRPPSARPFGDILQLKATGSPVGEVSILVPK